MKKNFFYICFFLSIFIPQILAAAELPAGISVTRSGSHYKIDFVLPSYSIQNITADGQNYFYLLLDDYGITPDAGLPCLPQISFDLMLNDKESKPDIVNLATSGGIKILSSKIYPAQAPWEKNKQYDERPFTINREYYLTKGIAKPFVTVSEPFVIGGIKGVRITINPFSYNPADNELTEKKRGSFEILTNSPAMTRINHSASFNDFLKSIYVNYPQATPVTSTNNYLIITDPAYESALAPFITQKTTLGYNVFTANTNATGNTTSAIKNYIQQRYNNMSTRPEFILLVGDVDKIPEWVGGGEGNPHTDLNYALLEGNDFFPDAFLGRFSVSNSTELSNIINKSIYMENNINGLPKKSIFMASNDNYTVSEGTHNFVVDSFFSPSAYTMQKLYVHTYGATTQQLISALNSNQSFAIYSGHGAPDYWADGPVLYQSDVNALTNNVYPFVYVFSCLTGQFQYPECMGETFIRGAHGGSIYWGSTIESYWDEDDILEKRLFRAMFTDHIIKTSPMFVQAKIYFVNYYGSITPTVQRYLEMYNLLGDPSMYEGVYGPSIAHTPLNNTENMNGPYPVNCLITPAGSVIDGSRTKIFWSRTGVFADSVMMTNTGGNNWTANISGNGNPASYRYYIKTADMLNRIVTSPGGAPSTYYSFLAISDTSKPHITHTAIGNTPRNQWPVDVYANVTDMIGIDSVWVKWYKNNPSTGIKEFRLNNTAGSGYSGMFNSDTSQVAYNDIIYYRIFGKDNSSNHNSDSTQLFSFNIIALATACIGNGGSAVSYPYNTYWWGSKTDMLYTADEIQSEGGSAGAITRIGFNVASYSSQTMNGFTIKMQATSMQTISNIVNTGWTTVYNGTYSVPGTGWQYIDLQTPFTYNGTDNLLIEICFGNPTYTTATTVNGSSINGMCVENHQDNIDGCSFTAGIAQSTRPNICFSISLLVGNQSSQNTVPKSYSLSQNYPNPFNPVTTIKYSVPKLPLIKGAGGMFVKLIVYDLLGKEVATLVNEQKSPGNYSVVFDGTNLASGVYFYRINAGDYNAVKKMVLIK